MVMKEKKALLDDDDFFVMVESEKTTWALGGAKNVFWNESLTGCSSLDEEDRSSLERCWIPAGVFLAPTLVVKSKNHGLTMAGVYRSCEERQGSKGAVEKRRVEV